MHAIAATRKTRFLTNTAFTWRLFQCRMPEHGEMRAASPWQHHCRAGNAQGSHRPYAPAAVRRTIQATRPEPAWRPHALTDTYPASTEHAPSASAHAESFHVQPRRDRAS